MEERGYKNPNILWTSYVYAPLADWQSTKSSEMKTRMPARLFSRSCRLSGFPLLSSPCPPPVDVITTSEGGRSVEELFIALIVATGLDKERVIVIHLCM